MNCRFPYLLLLILLTCLLGVGPSRAAEPAPDSWGGLAGEHYVYDLDFLFFHNLAEGEIRLEATGQPGQYRAELIGRTLGVAAWLTGDRTQRYTSLMEQTADGRLRSLVHEADILKRKDGVWKDRSKRYRFDYAAGKVYQEKGRDGVYHPGATFELPAGEEPVDLLTAFYNLRAGFYGPLVAGTRIEVPTFSSRGLSIIEVSVLTASERAGLKAFPVDGLLLKVLVDPEVFETGGGAIYVWLDKAGRPLRGVVEDIIGMGDVRGYYREEKSDEP